MAEGLSPAPIVGFPTRSMNEENPVRTHFTCPSGHPLFASVNVEHRLIQRNRAWMQTSSVSEVKVYCSHENCERIIPEVTKKFR